MDLKGPSSVTVLLSKLCDCLSSDENFKQHRLANKNGSLNKEDFANITVGTSYRLEYSRNS